MPNDILITRALAGGDLSSLDEADRANLYNEVCTSLGLNPLTSPIGFFTDEHGKTHLTLRKPGAQQLRANKWLSISAAFIQVIDNVAIVTVTGSYTAPDLTPLGASLTRTEVASGARDLTGLCGQSKANAFLAAETMAHRRLTIALAAIGLLDEETEVSQISSPAPEPKVNIVPQVNHSPAEITFPAPPPNNVPITPAAIAAAIPGITEAEAARALSTMDNEVNKQTDSQAEHIKPSKKAEVAGPPSIFDEQPSAFDRDIDFNSSVAQTIPKDVPAPPSTIAESSPKIESVPSTVDGEPFKAADADLPAMMFQPSPFTNTTPPPPDKEMHVFPPTVPIDKTPHAAKCDPIKFKEFTARCMKIVRDVLPKAGCKSGSDLLKPYLKQHLGVSDIQYGSPENWEAALVKLEKAGSPAATLAILKAK